MDDKEKLQKWIASVEQCMARRLPYRVVPGRHYDHGSVETSSGLAAGLSNHLLGAGCGLRTQRHRRCSQSLCPGLYFHLDDFLA
jgi:hypothetical protein